MENKNKNDMSVDDLVKQLKLVLEIDDDETGPVPGAAAAPEETSGESESGAENKPLSSPGSETMSEKVRMLDEFFDAEEKKTKKKERKKRRDKKKNIQDNDEPSLPIAAPVNEKTEFTEQELTEFADEIGDLFTDPEQPEKPAETEAPTLADETEKEEKADEQPVITPITISDTDITDAAEERIEEVTEFVDDAAENIKSASDEALPDAGITVEDGDDLDIKVTPIEENDVMEFIAAALPKNETTAPVEEDVLDGDDSPFVHNAMSSKEEAEPVTGGATKQFGSTVIVGEKPEPEAISDELPDDIAGFDSLFSDMHKDDGDGYTASDEAIMDAFGEMQEKPKKKPARSYSDLSVSELEEEQQLRDEEEEERQEERDRNYEEFTSYDQRKAFLDSYRRKYNAVKRSFILSTVFAILVIVYECLSLSPDKFPFFCSPEHNPAVFILIDLQLFALCSIFAVRYIVNGLKGIFSGKATASSLGALTVIFTFVYGIIAAFTAKPMPHPVISASALCVVVMLYAEIRCVKRDTLNFRVISSMPAKPRFVMESYTPRKNSEEEKEFYDYVPEDPTMLRISKTNFVRGFVGSNLKTSASKGYVNLMFPILALIFAGVLAIVLISRKDISSSINAAYTASALCMPAAVFTAITLPSYSCASKTAQEDSCVISEAAAEEYADASVVTFEDSDVFPPSLDKITSVRLYNDSRMDHIMYVLTSLFRKIGGPLLTICENAAKEYNEFSDNVTIDNAVEGGIEATVDSQKVYLGSSGYMGSKLDPKYASDDRQYDNNDKSRIMYMIINDIVCAKFYIEYEMDKDFVSVIKQLSTSTRCVAIRTLDPNIDTGLIKNRLDTEIYHCRIIRSRENERRKEVSKSSRGAVVSRNSVKALLRTLMLCDKTVYSSKINMVICFLAMIIGLIFSAVLIATNTYGSISALHVLAYQLLLLCVIEVVTRLNI